MICCVSVGGLISVLFGDGSCVVDFGMVIRFGMCVWLAVIRWILFGLLGWVC